MTGILYMYVMVVCLNFFHYEGEFRFDGNTHLYTWEEQICIWKWNNIMVQMQCMKTGIRQNSSNKTVPVEYKIFLSEK